MTGMQKALAWALGSYLWMNLLCILLSWYVYGYLDRATIEQMAIIAVPPLALGGALLYYFGAVRRPRHRRAGRKLEWRAQS